jgi:RIO kinase 2
LNTLVKFAKYGLIHGDYNEFNLMVNQEGTKLTVIDFPQCISVKHPNAKAYFDRDVECVFKYFDNLAEKSYHENMKDRVEGAESEERFNAEDYPVPQLDDIEIEHRLDH